MNKTIPNMIKLKAENKVPNVEVVNLDCGHWIQQEKPEETTQAILKWLKNLKS